MSFISAFSLSIRFPSASFRCWDTHTVGRSIDCWFMLPVFLLLLGLIGFTRVYLGAHWVSDVLGGWILGFGWVALGMSAAEATREY